MIVGMLRTTPKEKNAIELIFASGREHLLVSWELLCHLKGLSF